PAGTSPSEGQIRRRAGLTRAADAIRLQKILWRSVVAVVLLDALEDGELVAGAKVDFEIELGLVVNLFVELADPLVEARLPVAFEQQLRIVMKRGVLSAF